MENTTTQKPYIIVFEGIDGSGKSTQINIVYELLKDKNVKLLREPGSTEIGEKIRDILKSQKLDPKTQTFLIEASRANMIENHLKGFKGIVLLDRYIYSTIAYQGYGFGIDINFLKTLNDFVCDIYTPDIVFLLDIDPKTALKRLKREKDVFENLDFLERVRDGYLELAKEYSFYTIDASKNVEAITDEITAVLKQHGILS
ncbi:MAG: dTMP kinase [Hydrogenobaculum sp.]